MAKSSKGLDKKSVLDVKKLFRSDPALKHLTRHVEGGFRLLFYLFDATTAAEKIGVPKGFKVNPVEVSTSTKKGMAEVQVAQWFLKILEQQLAARATPKARR